MFGKLHLITASEAAGQSWPARCNDETAGAVSQFKIIMYGAKGISTLKFTAA